MSNPTEDTPTQATEYIVKLHNAHTGKVVEIPLPGALSAGYFSLEYYLPDIKKVEVVKVDNLTPAQIKAASKIPKPDDNPFIGQDDRQLREAVKRFCRTEEAADNLVAYIKAQQLQLVSELEGSVKKIENPRLVDRGNEAYFPDTAEEFRIGYTLAMAQAAKILEHKKQELGGKNG